MKTDENGNSKKSVRQSAGLIWRAILTSSAGLRFSLVVFVPFVVITAYLTMYASDRYVSETRFMIRDSGAPAETTSFDVGSLISGGNSIGKDAYVITEYIVSHDLLSLLDEKFALRAAWSNPEIDPLWRLSAEASDEDFLEYYNEMVLVSLDSETSIISVEFQHFDRELAHATLEMILSESEKLVNRISNQLAKDQIAFINSEIEVNQTRLKDAESKVIEFQNIHNVVNPTDEAGLVNNIIAQLEAGLAADRAKLSEMLSYMDRSAPEVAALRNSIAAKIKQIDKAKKRLTGSDNERLNSIMAQYEALMFDAEFARERYQTSVMALESTQIDASRKLKSLVVVSRPNMPDRPQRPDRPYLLASAAAFLLMGFGIFSVILAALREHLV